MRYVVSNTDLTTTVPFPSILRRSATETLNLCVECARTELVRSAAHEPDYDDVLRIVDAAVMKDPRMWDMPFYSFSVTNDGPVFTLTWTLDDQPSINLGIESSVISVLETDKLTSNIPKLVESLITSAQKALMG